MRLPLLSFHTVPRWQRETQETVENALVVYLSCHVAMKTAQSQKGEDEHFNMITMPKKEVMTLSLFGLEAGQVT